MSTTVFGPFTFDTSTGELFRQGMPVALPPKATRVLQVLIASPGRLITHEELYQAAWSETVVEFDQGLYACIRQIRKALGDDARNPRYIETVPKRGYRFCYTFANKPPRPHRKPVRVARWAAIVGVVVVLIGAMGLGFYGVSTWLPAPISGADDVALGDFRIEGFDVSTGGVDSRLETSVRTGLAMRGFNADHSEPAYLVTGRIAPAVDGARFHVALVRLSDGETVWTGAYNPFCPDVKGDPIRIIGHLVARTVVAKVKHHSA